MKPFVRSSLTRKPTTSGFTLIELLVVIAIIGILATLTGAGLFRAMRSARRNAAIQECTSISNGIELFYREYGWFPVPAANQGGDNTQEDAQLEDAATSRSIIQILIASSANTNLDAINPKKMTFLDLDFAAEDGVILDPWGRQYLIKLDLDFDGKVAVTGSGEEYRLRAIVWSHGEEIAETDDNIGNVDVAYD